MISKQFPSVAILGCSDSRVPTEIVFDQGLGDIFVIRVAGNCIGTSTLASLQYAVHHLKVKVLMVMGHEMCGAVKAAMLNVEALENEPSELEQVLKNIKTGLDETSLRFLHDSRARDREAVAANVRQQVERLTRESGIMAKVRAQELIIVGAFYDLSSGIVDFFCEVSELGEQNEGSTASTSEQPQTTDGNLDGEAEEHTQDEESVPLPKPSPGVQNRFIPPPQPLAPVVSTLLSPGSLTLPVPVAGSATGAATIAAASVAPSRASPPSRQTPSPTPRTLAAPATRTAHYPAAALQAAGGSALHSSLVMVTGVSPSSRSPAVRQLVPSR